ncbi:MAG: lipoprotein [Solirubrobacterales bacterium]|nr:lipoprotein [Solirubrobacterales bacterium]
MRRPILIASAALLLAGCGTPARTVTAPAAALPGTSSGTVPTRTSSATAPGVGGSRVPGAGTTAHPPPRVGTGPIRATTPGQEPRPRPGPTKPPTMTFPTVPPGGGTMTRMTP